MNFMHTKGTNNRLGSNKLDECINVIFDIVVNSHPYHFIQLKAVDTKYLSLQSIIINTQVVHHTTSHHHTESTYSIIRTIHSGPRAIMNAIILSNIEKISSLICVCNVDLKSRPATI